MLIVAKGVNGWGVGGFGELLNVCFQKSKVTNIYRRSHSGYECTYHCTDIYHSGRILKVALKSLKIEYL